MITITKDARWAKDMWACHDRLVYLVMKKLGLHYKADDDVPTLYYEDNTEVDYGDLLGIDIEPSNFTLNDGKCTPITIDGVLLCGDGMTLEFHDKETKEGICWDKFHILDLCNIIHLVEEKMKD